MFSDVQDLTNMNLSTLLFCYFIFSFCLFFLSEIFRRKQFQKIFPLKVSEKLKTCCSHVSSLRHIHQCSVFIYFWLAVWVTLWQIMIPQTNTKGYIQQEHYSPPQKLFVNDANDPCHTFQKRNQNIDCTRAIKDSLHKRPVVAGIWGNYAKKF